MKKLSYGLILSLLSAAVAATDLEIYVGGNQNIEPNVLLILDDSGSMNASMDGRYKPGSNFSRPPTGKKSRWEITVPIIKSVISKLANVRVGLALFNDVDNKTRKSRIIVPIGGLDEPISTTNTTNTRDAITQQLDARTPGGGTPLSVALEDVYRYLVGKERKSGDLGNNTLSGAYASPIIHECQNTLVTLFTDGAPSSGDTYNDSIVDNLLTPLKFSGTSVTGTIELPGIPTSTNPNPDPVQTQITTTLKKDCTQTSQCLDELAYHMSRVMHTPNTALNETFQLPQGQTKLVNKYDAQVPKSSQGVIRVSTIGAGTRSTFFNANNSRTSAGDLLVKTALAGRGEFFLADNEERLEAALTAALQSGAVANQSLVPPAISATSFNPLALDDFSYVPIFEPTSDGSINWVGNLKKYKFEVLNGIRQLIGQGGNALYIRTEAAPGATTGAKIEFNKNETDEWSSGSNNAADASEGGVREKLLKNNNRTIVTVVPTTAKPAVQNQSMVLLSNSSVDAEIVRRINQGVEIGTSSQKQIVQPDAKFSAADVAAFKNWVTLGRETPNTNPTDPNARDVFGAPIHGSPIPIITKKASSPTATDEKRLIVVGTDRGVLHFFDANSGDEKMAFIPPEMFAGLNQYRSGSADIQNKPMGMDGYIEVISDVRSGKKRVTLVVGTRRGSNVYYVLDLSIDGNGDLASSPASHKVTILNDKLSPLYARFGQTWARPILDRIKVNPLSDTENGLVVGLFSGGYDPRQDEYQGSLSNNGEPPLLQGDTVGNFIAMVNLDDPKLATYGKPIWVAMNSTEAQKLSLGTGVSVYTSGLDKMTNSFPSEPVWVDMDGDGLREKFFAVDINGRIFRFDLNKKTYNSTDTLIKNIKGGLVADLVAFGKNDTDAEKKRKSRRFYERPSVFRGSIPLRQNADKSQLAIGSKPVIKLAVGSGYRAHPLILDDNGNEYHHKDRFYLLALDNVNDIPSTYEAFTRKNILNKTKEALTYWNLGDAKKQAYDAEISNELAFKDSSGADQSFSNRKFGIYVNLFEKTGAQEANDGEKVISAPSTAAGQVLFTTYVPPKKENNQCTLNLGNSFLYALDAENWRADPYWQLGSAPGTTQPGQESSDFKKDQGRYPLPFPGLGASVAHTGPAFGPTGGGYATASVGGIPIHRHDQAGENSAKKALERLYWQELSE